MLSIAIGAPHSDMIKRLFNHRVKLVSVRSYGPIKDFTLIYLMRELTRDNERVTRTRHYKYHQEFLYSPNSLRPISVYIIIS